MKIQAYVPAPMYSSIDEGLLSWLKREFESIRRGVTAENVEVADVLEKRLQVLENRIRALEDTFPTVSTNP